MAYTSLEEIDRAEAMGLISPVQAAYEREKGAPAAASYEVEGPTQRTDPFADINEQTAAAAASLAGAQASLPGALGVEGVSVVEPELTRTQEAQAEAKRRGVKSRGASIQRERGVREGLAGTQAQQRMPTPMQVATQGPPAGRRGGGGFGGLGRRVRGVVEEAAGEGAQIAMERASVVREAESTLADKLDEMSSANERAAEVHKERSDLIKKYAAESARDRLSMKQLAMDQSEMQQEADDRAKYWNYEGTDEELRRDVMLASGKVLETADDDVFSEVSGHKAQLERDVQDARERLAAAEEVDPYRKFGGTWNTVLSALAMGMGAFGAALTGTPNYAMQIINKAIDRDIKAQLETKKGKKEASLDAKSLLAQNRKMFMDDIQAADVTKAQLLEASAAELESLLMKSQGAMDQAKGAEMIMGLKDQAQVLRQNAVDRGTDLQLKGADFELRTKKAASEAAARAAAAKGGAGGKVPVPMQDKMGSGKAFHQFLGRAREQFEKVGKWDVVTNIVAKIGPEDWEDAVMAALGAEAGAEYKKQFKQLALLYTKATQGSRPSDYDQKNVESILASIYTPKGMGLKIFDRMENDAKNQMASNIMAMKLSGVNTAALEGDFMQNFRVTPEQWLSGDQATQLVPSWERDEELGWSGQSFQPVKG